MKLPYIKKLSDAKYFALKAVSNSKLSRLAKCPAAMDIEIEISPQMLLGSLAHCLILEGREAFAERYAVAPECDKRTKEGKEIWTSFADKHADKIIITLDQLQACVGMATSVASHPSCQSLLRNGEPEMAIVWKEGKETCKSKADWLSPNALVDLKTTTNSEYGVFSETIIQSYARQLGMYRSGLHANGVYPEHVIIIAVESKPPYTTNVYELSEEVLTWGEGQYRDLLAQYSVVKKKKVKPSYSYAGIHVCRLPRWVKEIEG